MDPLFYLFALILVLASFFVISCKNSVHSVLFLIVVFTNSAILFLLLNAEFIAMLLVIVYVGAIAVLFLFIVIMLGVQNVKKQLNKKLLILVSLLLFLELALVYLSHDFPIKEEFAIIDTYTIGEVLYTEYFYVFQIAGIILLVAMVGAIILTLEKPRPFLRKQRLVTQLLRSSDIKLVKKL